MDGTPNSGKDKTASASQTRARYEVNLPGSLKITSSVMTQPFDVKDVTVRYVGYTLKGLFLTIETRAARSELSKMLVRRRTCYTICQFPGASRASRLFGEIDWVEPRLTPEDIHVRIGISLDESKPEILADLRAFLKSLEDRERHPSG